MSDNLKKKILAVAEETPQAEYDTVTQDDQNSSETVWVNLGDVEPTQVRWLWSERIALGKLTLLAGDPGLGKSFLTLDLAARVSRGAAHWPDRAENPNRQGPGSFSGIHQDGVLSPRVHAAPPVPRESEP